MKVTHLADGYIYEPPTAKDWHFGGKGDLRGTAARNTETNDKQDIRIEELSASLQVLDRAYIEDVTAIKTTLQGMRKEQ